MNTKAQVILNLFKQLESAQVAALEAPDDDSREKAQRQLNRVTKALQKTIIKKEA